MKPPAIQPCVCGIDVVCIPGNEPSGVAAHNNTRTHRAWRNWGGMERTVSGDVTGPETAHQIFKRMVADQTVVGTEPASWHYEHGHRVADG